MMWKEVIKRYARQPLIDPENLYAGGDSIATLQVQISRWAKEGKLLKLAQRRYLMAEEYRRADPSPGRIANWLVYPSYVSLEYALGAYGLIPEGVFVVTSVTTKRPRHYDTPEGRFTFRHIHRKLFWGYQAAGNGENESVMAEPEKALLDFFYFLRGPLTTPRFREMRWQNVEGIRIPLLKQWANRMAHPRVTESVERFLEVIK